MTKSEKKTGKIISHIALYICFVFLYLAFIFILLQLLQLFPYGKNHRSLLLPVNATAASPVTIILDAGHGGEDGGTIGHVLGDEVHEKDLNLTISLLIRDMLEADGVRVVMTREKDVLLYDRNVNFQGRKKVLDLAARLAVGQKTENAFFISIHMNAYPIDKYKGLQVYYSQNNPFSEDLAQVIQETVTTYLQPDNQRKIKAATSNIFLLDHLKCPAVLVECGFLSNPEECAALTRKDYRQKLAFLLYCSIKQTMLSYGSTESSSTERIFLSNPTILPAKHLIFGLPCGIMRQVCQQRKGQQFEKPKLFRTMFKGRNGQNYEGYKNRLHMFFMRIPKHKMVGKMPLMQRMEFLC